MDARRDQPKARGTGINPAVRFARSRFEPDPADQPPDRVDTVFYEDSSVSVVSENRSPDLPFEASLNPYRGCEHGCAYCYARPTHEYLGWSAGLDFETRILVKSNAARLLESALSAPSWQPRPLFLSGVTDPYQPAERHRQVTRDCLAVLARFRNPVSLITKNSLVLRDRDLLASFAAWGGVSVSLSVTTLDSGLARRMEPRTASPRRRLEAVAALAEAGIPVGVMAAPMIPGLTDTELPGIVAAAKEAGARWVHYLPLRLPRGTDTVFLDWLEREFPGKRARVEDRLRSLRGGSLNDTAPGRRFRGTGLWAQTLRQLYELGVRRSGFTARPHTLRTDAFRPVGGKQLDLFAR
ncbi:MAG: PA0069 family radical SAM protein [Opitutales bacterium]|nr:PA0069 family radical SAM protein [Opitutales bacterium]